MNRVIVLMAVIVAAAVVAPLAVAGNGTSQAGYGGEAAPEVALVESGTATATATASETLPVTGAEVGMILAAGGVLLLVGLGMRRLGRQKQ